MKESEYKICVLGPQGSGKGTQAELLAEKLNIPTFSMGQLLRDEVEKGTMLGKEIEDTLNRGILVPDNITNDLLKEHVEKLEKSSSFIIDGYPRRQDQFDYMESYSPATHVIALSLSDEESVKRIAGRRVCACGKIYHMDFRPPTNGESCDVCEAKLEIRDDDKPEAVKKRLEIYHNDTESVIEQYREKGKVHDIDASPGIQEVHESIMKIFA